MREHYIGVVYSSRVSSAAGSILPYLHVNFAGVFQEVIFVSGANITLEWYTHRVFLPLLVFEVSVQRTRATSYPLHISLNVRQWAASRDLDFSYVSLSAWSRNNIR